MHVGSAWSAESWSFQCSAEYWNTTASPSAAGTTPTRSPTNFSTRRPSMALHPATARSAMRSGRRRIGLEMSRIPTTTRVSQNRPTRAVSKPCAFFPRIAKAKKNGAGGNRTPVPEQSAGCFYARSWCFKSQRCAGHQQPAFLPSVQKPPRTIVWMRPDRTSLIIVIPRPIRRQVGDRLRIYAASAYCGLAVISVACFLRGQHAPRHATSSLPCPVETSRPQLVNANSTHAKPTKFEKQQIRCI